LPLMSLRSVVLRTYGTLSLTHRNSPVIVGVVGFARFRDRLRHSCQIDRQEYGLSM
jgi:hypothetical protein